MIIRLPKKFSYKDTASGGCAYVNKGRLYIEGNINFESLMYKLTYDLKGQERCCYCGGYLTKKNRTIDHMYPRNFGGVSIPDNLLPCCKQCNHSKMDMTYDQFQEWRKITSLKEKDKFYRKCILENTKYLKRGKFLIPRKWIVKYNTSEMAMYIKFNNARNNKYRKIERHFAMWNQYPEPIIISSNGWLLKGKNILSHARNHNRRRLCAIVLENVVVIKNSP